MFPVFKLVAAHPKLAIINNAQPYITVSNYEITLFKAHWLGTVATTTTLVKH